MGALVLVDGMYEVYRADKSVGHLSTSTGTPSGILFGFLRALESYRGKFGAVPVVVWDGSSAKRRTFIPEYKSNRIAWSGFADSPRAKQIQSVKQVLSVLGVVQVFHPEWEADDVLGTLSKFFENFGLGFEDVVVVTGDSDLFQIVSDRVKCWVPVEKKKTLVDRGWVEDKYGIEPKHLPILWALSGDPSDCIKGVKGIGPHKAAEIVKSGKALGEIQDICGEQIEQFQKALDAILLRTELYEGLCWTWPEPDWGAVTSKFGEYEFNSFLKEDSKWPRFFEKACEGVEAIKSLVGAPEKGNGD